MNLLRFSTPLLLCGERWRLHVAVFVRWSMVVHPAHRQPEEERESVSVFCCLLPMTS